MEWYLVPGVVWGCFYQGGSLTEKPCFPLWWKWSIISLIVWFWLLWCGVWCWITGKSVSTKSMGITIGGGGRERQKRVLLCSAEEAGFLKLYYDEQICMLVWMWGVEETYYYDSYLCASWLVGWFFVGHQQELFYGANSTSSSRSVLVGSPSLIFLRPMVWVNWTSASNCWRRLYSWVLLEAICVSNWT